ncbi:Holliday junction DNA helicase RuvA [Candidatus Peregrinibacteria bacterium RIFCSPLOWO2_02_FULL_48_14]|nr:MAG: Holliday junction DNA helicase RuvA [Candidatus Peregrinibacteria bacterium RIFCSPLOWO2_02_FULL_48_14]
MIRLLQGQIHSKDDRTIILFVNGVGYHVFVPLSILASDETEITLWIHSHVREDAFTLFGFRTKNELSFFELLLTINGIGPKMAMDIMNQPVDQIRNAIFTGNVPALTHIPGIGKKTAERMILELKSKIEPSENLDQNFIPPTELNDEVVSALENLGYKRSHIQNVLSQMDEPAEGATKKTSEEIIRIFLQRV